MTNLLPPSSWPERKRRELLETLPSLHEADKEKFIYLGCCMDFTPEELSEMEDAEEKDWPGEGDKVELMREWCAGFDQWCEVMGYVSDPSKGLTIANDQTLSYGKSHLKGIPCYWISHSRIEYVWVDREYIKVSFETKGTVTGRMSCREPNLSAPPRPELRVPDNMPTEASTPAEKAKLRAAAKTTSFSPEMASPFEHFARQEASSIAMGLPPGDHEVTLDVSDMPDKELSKLMADPLQLRQEEKVQRFNRDMIAKGRTAESYNTTMQKALDTTVDRISQEISELSKEEAAEYLAKWQKEYPQIAKYSDKIRKIAQEKGIAIMTAAQIGRRNLLDDANNVSNHELEKAVKSLVGGFGDDPHVMTIVPLAISMTDMDKWGCAYCGYSQGKIPATAEGTMLWVCLSCTKESHVLRDGLEKSNIAFLATNIFPKLTTHPREGQPKHSERHVTTSHEQDSDSQDNGTEGLGDSAEG